MLDYIAVLKRRTNPLNAVFSIYALIIFVAVMFLILPLVVAASFFGKVRGGNLIYRLCRFWTDTVMIFWGIRHRNIFEAEQNQGPTVFVFNHISYLDIPLLLQALRNRNIRVLGKASMKKIPLFGYIYGKTAISVDRSCEAARAASVTELKAALAENISIVLFPEGTFNTTHEPLLPFYNGAFRIAAEMNIPIQPVLFLDTYRLMHYSSIFSLRPGISRALFLDVVSPGPDPESLKNAVHSQMTAAIERNHADWLEDN